MATDPDSNDAPKPPRDTKGRILPGQSLNPLGRSKTQKEFKEAARDAAEVAFALKLKHVDAAMALDDSNLDDGANALRHIASRDAKEIIEQAYGKPTQHVEADVRVKAAKPIEKLVADLEAKLRGGKP